MAVEAGRAPGRDAADVVADVALAKREVLLHVYRRRLRWEDLEDCFSQAMLELVARARRGAEFDGPQHVANALEQKFVSRINDRHRAMGGRSGAESALAGALSVEEPGEGGHELVDRRSEVPDQVEARLELSRLREVASDLTADQRLVLACQVGLGMDCAEFCARFGWSAEKFRKVAQRGRAKLRVLVGEYQSGDLCQRLEPLLLSWVAGCATPGERHRIELHFGNCQACARTARELDRASRDVASVLPISALAHPAGMGKLALAFAAVRRVLHIGSGSPAGTAGGASAAAGGGGAMVGAGGSVLGVGGVKFGVAALCLAGAAGGYAVCRHAGMFPTAPPPRHHAVPRASSPQRSGPTATRADGSHSAVPEGRQEVAVPWPPTRPAARPVRRTATAQAQREFGLGGAPARTRSPRAGAPRARAATVTPTGARSRSTNSTTSTGSRMARHEFGFEG